MGLFARPRWKPVSVLTGFLGSGKTTILQHLLKQKDMAGTALIINEFGEVSVDHLLVETPEEKMVLLSNGCVCCSVRGDLVQAIASLFKRQKNDEIPPFQRILLETTGLADPSPILQSLIGPGLQRYPVYLDTLVSTLDSSNALEAIEDNPVIEKQIALADEILLTKTDIAEIQDIEKLATLAREINPRAKQQRVIQGVVAPSLIFGRKILNPETGRRELRKQESESAHIHASSPSAHAGINSFVLRRSEAINYSVLEQFLKALHSYQGSKLLRLKGLVKVRGQEKTPWVIHGVQGVMHPPHRLPTWPGGQNETQLVFIGKELVSSDIESLLHGIERGFR